MKLPATSFHFAALAGISLVTPAFAVVNIDYVPVGNAGNANDAATGSLYGAVACAYKIGKYEVTNAQYTAFLNAVDPSGANANGIYNGNMGSDARGGITYTSGAASGSKYTIRTSMGDKPVNFVNWYDAARFTNWLHNGQGSGSTETGAYTLSGNTGLITKNVGASVWLPSEDEWYKAAYYDPTTGPTGPGDNYWEYATRRDTAPTIANANSTGDIGNPGANTANHDFGADWNSLDGNVTTVGSAGAGNMRGNAPKRLSMVCTGISSAATTTAATATAISRLGASGERRLIATISTRVPKDTAIAAGEAVACAAHRDSSFATSSPGSAAVSVRPNRSLICRVAMTIPIPAVKPSVTG